MYNIPGTISSFGPMMGALKHTRDFSTFSYPAVDRLPGKSFKNPNFVNEHFPKIHCTYSSNSTSIPHCQNSDISNKVTEKNNSNSSQNTVEDSTKEIPCEEKNSPMCYSRKRCKKVRRNRKKKAPNKNSKQNSFRGKINDMMDIDLEPDISTNNCDSNMLCMSPKSLILANFVPDIPSKSSKDDEVFTVISISPTNNLVCPRERDLSVCESEDSFIVFDSGTDDELKFSDSDNTDEISDDDDDDDYSVSDSDIDSSYSVVPCKRVRFADKEVLCEIHPMVQWSFAYRTARKGPWEEYARDRERFNKRIKRTESILGPIFDQEHRENVYKERFDGKK